MLADRHCPIMQFRYDACTAENIISARAAATKTARINQFTGCAT
jgi:hypothetical protein